MNNLLTYTRTCKNTIGDTKRVYLVKFVDYYETEILTNNGVVITFPENIIYQFDVEGGYTQSSELKGGAIGWTQDVNINLNKVYNVLDPAIFTNQKFRLIAETNNGYYLIFGLFNGLDCSLNNGSGEAKDAFNGFSLNFTGLEEEAAMLTDLNNYFLFNGDSFNYDFNFNI